MLSDFWLAFLVAIALAAMVNLVIIIVRIFILSIKYKKFRSVSVPATGIVGELKNITSNYNKRGDLCSYSYNYALKITTDNQEIDDIYSEECKPGDPPITCAGDTINSLWSMQDHKYLNLDRFKPECLRIAKQTVTFTVEVFLDTLSRRPYR